MGAEPFDPASAWLAAAGQKALPLDPARFVTRMFRYAPVLDFAELHGTGLRAADDVTVLLHAHAAGIDMSPDGRRAVGVGVRRRNAPDLRIAASAVVLATGGIENARLLLLSGLGNCQDLVGRHFMEHLFLDDAASVVGLGPSALFRPYFRRMSAHGRQFKAALAPTAGLLAQTGLPNLAIKLASASKRAPGILALLALRDRLTSRRPGMPPQGAVRRLLTDLPRTARAVAQVVQDKEMGTARRPEPLLASVVGEQAPNPASRVTLSERRDEFGQPLARVDWRLLERDRQALWRALELLRDEFERTRLGRVTLPDDPGKQHALAGLRGGRHHMGTTRMASAARFGVVDPDCRVHGIDNLFVAGSSVFPTSGHANPTLTIVALALRLADRIRRDAPGLLAKQS
ncbi:MAG: GMC oxidoreductase [Geminicoccaceae bacterium]